MGETVHTHIPSPGASASASAATTTSSIPAEMQQPWVRFVVEMGGGATLWCQGCRRDRVLRTSAAADVLTLIWDFSQLHAGCEDAYRLAMAA